MRVPHAKRNETHVKRGIDLTYWILLWGRETHAKRGETRAKRGIEAEPTPNEGSPLLTGSFCGAGKPMLNAAKRIQ